MSKCKWLASMIVFAWLVSADAVYAEKVFRAGAYAQDITPHFPISMNGGMRDRTAKGSHDPLHARCLVLDDGDMRIAIAVVDSCMIPRDILDRAKKLASATTKIPTDRMLISATHTHTAPTVGGVFQSEPDKKYQKALAELIARGIAVANSRLKPARVGWGVGKNPNQVFNRRWFVKNRELILNPFGELTDLVRMNPPAGNEQLDRPAGPIDPDVSVLAVQSKEGKPLALLANYSLHYVGGIPPNQVSADYFGEFARVIAKKLNADEDFVGIMSNGTSGDINNINFRERRKRQDPFVQVRIVAEDVAKTAFDVYQKIPFRDHVKLDMVEREIELGVRKGTEAELKRARDILEKAGARVLEEIYARETVLLDKYPDNVKLKLQAIRIGDLAITAIPCEVFVEIGLELKKKSPFKHTFTIELANGYNGYLPTPEQHKLKGYETWRARSSYLKEDSSPKIVANLLEMLNELHRR
ncbi:MAG: hypothetical protein KatS3mg105_4556 [Gemmatales bacterium]|nr:MAG: hypothetical protein KatS3mg105_4556 [Gemmatales bacterium]